MMIVAGLIRVRPDQRETYLATCVEVVEQARAAAGCLDYVIGPDLVESDRINIFERWESRAAVAAFRGDGPSDEQSAAMTGASVAEYEIGETRPLT